MVSDMAEASATDAGSATVVVSTEDSGVATTEALGAASATAGDSTVEQHTIQE